MSFDVIRIVGVHEETIIGAVVLVSMRNSRTSLGCCQQKLYVSHEKLTPMNLRV